MANLWQKARERGLSLGNILSYLSLTSLRVCGEAYSTLALKLKARLLGISLGQKVTAHGPVGLLRWPGGRIDIGHGVHFISSWRRATAQTLYAPVRLRVFGPGAAIEIGDGCELSGTSITARSQLIRLGKNVLLGPNCVIVDSDFHAPWPAHLRSSAPGYERDLGVRIDDYAWIGMQCLILKGVHIGRGAIIGAGSVVTRDIPAMTVACGNPCRVVKTGPASERA
ncbi:MAG: acyltransferase [Desulfovibrio sp.]|nr:acyltransferase [Desulfovibrio sp.]